MVPRHPAPNPGASFDDASNYKLILPPNDRFYADPFLFEKDGKTFLFLEDLRYSEGRALISCCELNADGTTYTLTKKWFGSQPPAFAVPPKS